MKIGVLGKISKVKSESIVTDLISFLQELGHETVRFSSPLNIQDVDLAVILGGDGAILHSAVIAAKNGVKIVGINYGNLGFLTEYEKDERERIQELLTQLETGNCRILKRSLLSVEIEGRVYYALNEVAVQRDNGSLTVKLPQILKLQLQTHEGTSLVSGDGLLICTPTGSTAYSLSAGGAILTPEIPVFMTTPICAFSTRSRPMVFSDTETFKVSVLRGNAMLMVDGHVVAGLTENEEITVKKAPFTADFPVRETSAFLDKVKNKLND